MSLWHALEYGAWGGAGALILWMVIDALRVGAEYDPDVLVSSREGADELLEQREERA